MAVRLLARGDDARPRGDRLGYLSSGIVPYSIAARSRLLVNDNPVLPPICAQGQRRPADGMSARLLGPAIRARLQGAGGRVSVQATWAHATWT